MDEASFEECNPLQNLRLVIFGCAENDLFTPAALERLSSRAAAPLIIKCLFDKGLRPKPRQGAMRPGPIQDLFTGSPGKQILYGSGAPCGAGYRFFSGNRTLTAFLKKEW